MVSTEKGGKVNCCFVVCAELAFLGAVPHISFRPICPCHKHRSIRGIAACDKHKAVSRDIEIAVCHGNGLPLPVKGFTEGNARICPLNAESVLRVILLHPCVTVAAVMVIQVPARRSEPGRIAYGDCTQHFLDIGNDNLIAAGRGSAHRHAVGSRVGVPGIIRIRQGDCRILCHGGLECFLVNLGGNRIFFLGNNIQRKHLIDFACVPGITLNIHKPCVTVLDGRFAAACAVNIGAFAVLRGG